MWNMLTLKSVLRVKLLCLLYYWVNITVLEQLIYVCALYTVEMCLGKYLHLICFHMWYIFKNSYPFFALISVFCFLFILLCS